MTTAYSQFHPAGFGTPWDKAVPVQNDQDSVHDYVLPREQSGPFKGHMNSETFHVGYENASDRNGSLSSDYERSRSIGSAIDGQPVDGSAWIHRDKLAQIETQEMQEAGLGIRQPVSRSRSRSGHRSRSRGSDMRRRDSSQPAGKSPQDSAINAAIFLPHGDKHNPHVPYDSQGQNYHDSGLVETQGFGFEDAPKQSPRLHSSSRPGTSRIPVSRNSPAPLSSAFLERDSPTPRSRNGSLAFPTSPELPMHRPRSLSLGSRMMLEESGGAPRSRPTSMHLGNSPHIIGSPQLNYSPASSPRMSKAPKPAPLNPKKTQHNRAASISSKARVGSTSSNKDSPSGRPRSGHMQPRHINPPEGEAPWIASMYKPDPMLPPDQQILPTHAKKMMQEQWAREGATGGVYDKDFNLLDSSNIAPLRPATKEPLNGSVGEGGGGGGGDSKQPTFPTGNRLGADSKQPKFPTGNRLGGADDDDIEDSFPKPWRPESGLVKVGEYHFATITNSDSTATGGGKNRGHRQSMYRLQTVGALPREEQVRDEAAHNPDTEQHGTMSQLQPKKPDDEEPEGEAQPQPHTRITRLGKSDAEEEKGAGCCKCVVM